MSSFSEESNSGPRVLKGTPFQQHYQILNFHEKRLARLEKRMGSGDSTNNSVATDQQVKMLVQHIQQLSRRIAQMETASREATRKAQTVDIVMGQKQSQLSDLSTDDDSVADISIVSEASPVPKQKGRKKKGKNVRLEVSEN